MRNAFKIAIWLFGLGILAGFWSCRQWDGQLSSTHVAEDSEADVSESAPQEQAETEPVAENAVETDPSVDSEEGSDPAPAAPIPEKRRPTVKLLKAESSDAELLSFWVRAVFDEPVVGFDADDVAIIDGRVEAFLGGPLEYQLEVRRFYDRDVVLQIPAEVAEDDAGNGNMASSELRVAFARQESPMRTVWGIDEDDTSLTLPLPATRTEDGEVKTNAYHFVVDWGDGSPMSAVTSSDDEDATHVYAHSGDYTVIIYGLVEAWEGDKEAKTWGWSEPPLKSSCRLKAVLDAGSVGWKSLEYAFAGCLDLGAFSGGDFSQVINMRGMFLRAQAVVPDTKDWDVSNVVDMSSLFAGAYRAKPNTEDWDVSNVVDMSQMFVFANSANPNTKNWNVSNVTNMFHMFAYTNSANPDIKDWNVSNVTNMASMFDSTRVAEPEVGYWDVSSVTDMSRMFAGASKAKPSTANWVVSSVTNMSYMFTGAPIANPNVENWDVLNVENTEGMFLHALKADPDMLDWTPHSLENADGIFSWSGITRERYCRFLIMLAREILEKGLITGSSAQSDGCEAKNLLLTHGWILRETHWRDGPPQL